MRKPRSPKGTRLFASSAAGESAQMDFSGLLFAANIYFPLIFRRKYILCAYFLRHGNFLARCAVIPPGRSGPSNPAPAGPGPIPTGGELYPCLFVRLQAVRIYLRWKNFLRMMRRFQCGARPRFRKTALHLLSVKIFRAQRSAFIFGAVLFLPVLSVIQ